MKAYLEEKESMRKQLKSSAFLPLGLMLTEEMYKANNFILDKWLKRGTNDEQSASASNAGEQGSSISKDGGNAKNEQKAAEQNNKGDEHKSKKNDKDEEDNDDDNDNDDHNDYDNRDDDNNDDNDGGVMMPIPDMSF
jgi:hypothetical protein